MNCERIQGLAVSRGIAIGRAVLLAHSRSSVRHYYISAEQVEAEIARLAQARRVVVAELEALQAALPDDAPPELAGILEVHMLLLQDPDLIASIKQWVSERHYNAEWALTRQLEILVRQFEDMDDDYLRERKADLEQVVERVLQAMQAAQGGISAMRQAEASAQALLGGGLGEHEAVILVAHDLMPADMLQFKSSVFSGFITDVGGPTAHTAIVARSMDIPAVVGTRVASQQLRQDDLLILDGDAGLVLVNPSPATLEEYRRRQAQELHNRARLEQIKHTPCRSADGHAVELLANIEQPQDAALALAAGAVGVGLFRSEFLFMGRGGELPDEEEQYLAYKQAVEGMQGLPVTIRTLDIGADKPLDGNHAAHPECDPEDNPALGLRAIRWSLAEPIMFRTQLRALLRAAQHGTVKILIPMLCCEAEILQVFEQLAQSRAELDARGQAYGAVQMGAMIEIPAAALQADRFLDFFDFLSIGTNDLIQYTLAIDRTDERLMHLYNPRHPAVLQLIAHTIAAANRRAKAVSVCGEMAGDTAYTQLLLGLGLRSFSMHPVQLLPVKAVVLGSRVQA
ncbi:MAG: phosphoenolpyruvate--protein phosphotransferase [Brachymonas sp.]|jgi:phosphotransferase system enzyme I (PtsI)